MIKKNDQAWPQHVFSSNRQIFVSYISGLTETNKQNKQMFEWEEDENQALG